MISRKIWERFFHGVLFRSNLTDDAYLMVTQTNWEDEVIWNGEEIKHKVLQKLNSKTNAAGWVPSSFNRTAGM